MGKLLANAGAVLTRRAPVVHQHTPSSWQLRTDPEASRSSLTTWGHHRSCLAGPARAGSPKEFKSPFGGETQIYSKNPNKLEKKKLETELVSIRNHWAPPAVQTLKH